MSLFTWFDVRDVNAGKML